MLLCLTGCAFQAPFVPPVGMLSSIRAPLDIEANKKENGSKTGATSAYNILGLVAWGDLSYETAAKNGRISVIKNSSYDYFNAFFVFQKMTVYVYGD